MLSTHLCPLSCLRKRIDPEIKINGFAVAYHPQLVAVDHQHAVLYIIKAQGHAPTVMIYAYGDDIPSLAAWIKKERSFRFVLFW